MSVPGMTQPTHATAVDVGQAEAVYKPPPGRTPDDPFVSDIIDGMEGTDLSAVSVLAEP